MKKTISQHKNWVRRVPLFYIFANLLLSYLKENCTQKLRILLPVAVSCMQPLGYSTAHPKDSQSRRDQRCCSVTKIILASWTQGSLDTFRAAGLGMRVKIGLSHRQILAGIGRMFHWDVLRTCTGSFCLTKESLNLMDTSRSDTEMRTLCWTAENPYQSMQSNIKCFTVERQCDLEKLSSPSEPPG